MGLQISATSPYIYVATSFFATSALSSDLLLIRFALTNGFLFLVLANLSGHSTDGSFSKSTLPYIDGTIDLPTIINACLFLLNLVICIRLISDEIPKRKLNEEEAALFRFFHCRCGLNRLQFDEILASGHFLELDTNEKVPHVESTLYLVLQGQVQCHVQYNGNMEQNFIYRSGQFFDMKLFNIFKLPIGFDANYFHAKTKSATKFFGWNVEGLIRMRNLHSPNLRPYWEYMVFRSLAGVAIRHHLNDATDTLFDSSFIPEDLAWLEGAPSRDFGKEEVSTTGSSSCCQHWKQELSRIKMSLMNIIPPKGIRHPPPSSVLRNIPRQDAIEIMAKAKLYSEDHIDKIKKFYFLPKREYGCSTTQQVDNTKDDEMKPKPHQNIIHPSSNRDAMMLENSF